MKNFLIVVAVILVLLLAGVVVLRSLSSRAIGEADRAFAAAEPEARFVARYPEIPARNASAAKLEELAAALAVDIRSAQETGRRKTFDVDPAVMRGMTEWLQAQHERADDGIAPLPPAVQAWITGRAAEIDEVAKHLVASEVPRWPLSHTGRRSEQPLPNLLGHMKLGRVLAASALEAESRGDHARAWMLEQAAWKLTQGLLGRPELISQLIAIANVRTIAATARKLEPPVPGWFREVATLHPRDGVYDALRYETTTTRLSMNGSPREILFDSDGASLPERAAEVVLAPVLRWAAADVTAAAAAEFQSLRSGSPCALDAKVANDRVRARTSPLARRFGNAMMPNVGSAFVRAANLEVAVEGTEKVLALKTARQSMGLWPQELPVSQSSVCSGSEWSYTTNGETARLHFTGRVPEPPSFSGTRVPAEYVANRD